MTSYIESLRESTELSGDLENDIVSFLHQHDCHATADHSLQVAKAAESLAYQFHADPVQAKTAALLHDCSAVIPNKDKIAVAKELHLPIYEEEKQFPMVIHQRLSNVMGSELFHVKEAAILNAVECHTTLKKEASILDEILFVADKLEWDQKGKPPYLDELTLQLEHSLSHAAFAYLDFMWSKRHTLKVIHPWLKEAHQDLKAKLKADTT
ncbi:bis(5'-nucleosyl)-tetraphosphatase (symmetrical) YqeK [Bacillus daqingensis]|uniref:bis(5'-nucleosyl)-tetraphosphatase (symmetrical) n=1 Tax=Bacillus daqingensis TaxID=872396 RepID=A0ABV9NV21_9BACI